MMKSIGNRDDRYFGAQSLHLRCGSVSHPPGFTMASYRPGAGFSSEPAANLRSDRILNRLDKDRLFSAHSSLPLNLVMTTFANSL